MPADVDEGTTPLPDPDQAWKALSLVNDWVRHAETKVAATLAAAGVSAGVLYNLLHGWKGASGAAVGLGYITALALLSVGWACAMGLLPRRVVARTDPGFVDHVVALVQWMRAKSRPRRPEPEGDAAPEDLVSLLFYSNIARAYVGKGPEYREVLSALTIDRAAMTEHISQQVHANAAVADRKFDWANRAIARLLFVWGLLGLLAYFRVMGW